MICASCGESTAETPCPHCGESTLLSERYTLDIVVGQGATGITYRAHDAQTDEAVAVKEMPLGLARDTALLERIEREASVLRQLDHPCIPRYIDHFMVRLGKQRTMYLVQSFVDGMTLREELETRRYTEAEVLEMLDALMGILEYLHSLSPPVIHRDLKPGNVSRRKADGQLVLLDFGAVRDVLRDPNLGGSTVAGTYGYMAPEQFRGDASPQTDLYGAGVIAIVQLSRKDPLDLVRSDHALDWAQAVNVSPGTQALLSDLLQADPAKRPASATEVRRRIAALGDQAPAPGPAIAPRRPTASPTFQGSRSLSVPGAPTRYKWIAFVLAATLGTLGIHHFYLGNKGRGILSLIFAWSLIPLIFNTIDAINLWTMSHAEFDARHNPALAHAQSTAEMTAAIERLHGLMEKGALTPEEFEDQKRRLLDTPQGSGALFDTARFGRLFNMSGRVLGQQLSGLESMLNKQLKNVSKEIDADDTLNRLRGRRRDRKRDRKRDDDVE